MAIRNPYITKNQKIESLQYQVNKLIIEKEELQKRLSASERVQIDRHEAVVGQVIQSMSLMMEAAARVALSLHKNIK